MGELFLNGGIEIYSDYGEKLFGISKVFGVVSNAGSFMRINQTGSER
jgi:hypothetical protein